MADVLREEAQRSMAMFGCVPVRGHYAEKGEAVVYFAGGNDLSSFFFFFFSFFPFLSFFPPPLGFSYFLGGHLADRLRFGPPVMELFSPYLCVADEQNAILQGSIPSWC